MINDSEELLRYIKLFRSQLNTQGSEIPHIKIENDICSDIKQPIHKVEKVEKPDIELNIEEQNKLFDEFILSDDKYDAKYKQLVKIIKILNLPMNDDILRKYKLFIIDKYELTDHFNIIKMLKTDDKTDDKINLIRELEKYMVLII